MATNNKTEVSSEKLAAGEDLAAFATWWLDNKFSDAIRAETVESVEDAIQRWKESN